MTKATNPMVTSTAKIFHAISPLPFHAKKATAAYKAACTGRRSFHQMGFPPVSMPVFRSLNRYNVKKPMDMMPAPMARIRRTDRDPNAAITTRAIRVPIHPVKKRTGGGGSILGPNNKITPLSCFSWRLFFRGVSS